MKYNATFHDARITRNQLAEMLKVAPEEVTEKASVEFVGDMLTDRVSSIAFDPDTCTLDISGAGCWESASYGYGEELEWLLRHCEPGAYIHEIGAEGSSGEQWRIYITNDRTLKTVSPEVIWPAAPTATQPELQTLTPFDTGEILEPKPWGTHDRDGNLRDWADFGKVDFDHDDGLSMYTVQIVMNDPIPVTGERYAIRITDLAEEPYILEKEY